MFVCDRVVVNVEFIGGAALLDHVRKESVVYVIVQVRDGHFDGRRFTYVELVDLEPEREFPSEESQCRDTDRG